tara:strand:- start:208 stop:399 length:192 start_codon:yes stop_codon:yes gene_type:complete
MVNIKTKEFIKRGGSLSSSIDIQTNEWLKANKDIILDIVDIKYHTQMTEDRSESSVLIIYETK